MQLRWGHFDDQQESAANELSETVEEPADVLERSIVQKRPNSLPAEPDQGIPKSANKHCRTQHRGPENHHLKRHAPAMNGRCEVKEVALLRVLKQPEIQFRIHLGEDLWDELRAIFPIAVVVLH